MRILVTNDDGIRSDGIRRLAEAARKYGEVWVVAPMEQRSAMSHRITLRDAIDVYKVDFPVDGVHAYASTGTPADCVRFGLLNIVKGKTDLVLSGINYGYNAGSDLQYSATVGAALEAACTGVQAIAFSEDAIEFHPVTDAYLAQMIEELMAKPLPRNQIWNVNFPKCPLSELNGILRDRKVAENAFYNDVYLEEQLPDGGLRLRVQGSLHTDAAAGTDFRAIVDNYISVGIVHNLS